MINATGNLGGEKERETMMMNTLQSSASTETNALSLSSSIDSRHPGLSPGFLTAPPLSSTGSDLSQDQLSSETAHVRTATSTHPAELNHAHESSQVQPSIALAKTNQPSL
jgi:hypothetical protein